MNRILDTECFTKLVSNVTLIVFLTASNQKKQADITMYYETSTMRLLKSYMISFIFKEQYPSDCNWFSFLTKTRFQNCIGVYLGLTYPSVIVPLNASYSKLIKILYIKHCHLIFRPYITNFYHNLLL